MNYLEKCNSSEEIMSFMKKLEQELIRQNLSKENDKKTPASSWILLPIMISLIILVGLIIIVKLRYKRKKVK